MKLKFSITRSNMFIHSLLYVDSKGHSKILLTDFYLEQKFNQSLKSARWLAVSVLLLSMYVTLNKKNETSLQL